MSGGTTSPPNVPKSYKLLRRLADAESDLHGGRIDSRQRLHDFLRRELFLDMTGGIDAERDHPLLAGKVTADDLARWPWVDFDRSIGAAPAAGPPSLATHLERLHDTTHTGVTTVQVRRTGTVAVFLMDRGPYLAWLSLTFLGRLPGRFLRRLPLDFGRHDYHSGFVARRSAEDLPPFRQLEAIMRETALAADS